MVDEQRIQQFKQMTEADPKNELGHFSLGKACLEAGRYQEAAASFERAIGLNPKLSKAYQMLGEAYDKASNRDRAVEVMTRGVTVADGQGDRMPRDAMAASLRAWGAAVPAFQSSAAGSPEHTGPALGSAVGFRCVRCGSPASRLEKPPFKGNLGQRIHAKVCQSCWREWIGMGTKVINELGLVLSTESGQKVYDQYMVEFLQLEEP